MESSGSGGQTPGRADRSGRPSGGSWAECAVLIGRTEVTFADYDFFARKTSRNFPDDLAWGRANRPVINVTKADAQAYAKWLSDQTGREYRLPSEAEWEYAARGGTTTPFWTGTCIDTAQVNYNGSIQSGHENYSGCGGKPGLDRQRTVPAGSLPPNAFGLHEVAGNVYEFVADCWHPNYDGAPRDGGIWLNQGGGDCARLVLRGGSWFNYPTNQRSAFRLRNDAVSASARIGFRLVRVL